MDEHHVAGVGRVVGVVGGEPTLERVEGGGAEVVLVGPHGAGRVLAPGQGVVGVGRRDLDDVGVCRGSGSSAGPRSSCRCRPRPPRLAVGRQLAGGPAADVGLAAVVLGRQLEPPAGDRVGRRWPGLMARSTELRMPMPKAVEPGQKRDDHADLGHLPLVATALLGVTAARGKGDGHGHHHGEQCARTVVFVTTIGASLPGSRPRRLAVTSGDGPDPDPVRPVSIATSARSPAGPSSQRAGGGRLQRRGRLRLPGLGRPRHARPGGASAVTAVSASLAAEEAADCAALADEWGLRWRTVDTDELDRPGVRGQRHRPLPRTASPS